MTAPSDFRVDLTRGPLVESRHQVAVAVVDTAGRLLASHGDPDLVTFWRSAAKPFQAMPVLLEGAAARWGFGSEHLALACASHSSEPEHLALADRMLAAIGCDESDLACGPHLSLSREVAEETLRRGQVPTPRWNNCSGKHAAMLALARHLGWPLAGYAEATHPVQQRILAEAMRWTGADRDEIVLGVDGCMALSIGLPLRKMALAYARFGSSDEPAARQLREAMMAHPHLVAGRGRLCTDLMAAAAGRLVAKIGAEGVYCAALLERGLGVALKVADGDMRSASAALVGVLGELDRTLGLALPLKAVAEYGDQPIRSTRGTETGRLHAVGRLAFV